MLRLTRTQALRERLREERGSSATIVAILMVSLMLVAAVVIDVSAMQLERQQLQTGADAAALAIAQDCAAGDCRDAAATASSLVAANHTYGDDSTAALDAIPIPESGTVTVRAGAVSEHFFAGILGIDSTTVGAAATANWGSPTGGTLDLPLIVSWCTFMTETGGIPSEDVAYTLDLPKHGGPDCTDADGTHLPGGFGWLDPTDGTCTLESSIDEEVGSDPGNDVPNVCGPEDFQKIQHQTILLPVFVEYDGQGNNATYQIYAYAAFRITGYHLGNQPGTYWNTGGGGSERWIRGHLVEYIPYDGSVEYDPDAPNIGTTVVRLAPTEETP